MAFGSHISTSSLHNEPTTEMYLTCVTISDIWLTPLGRDCDFYVPSIRWQEYDYHCMFILHYITL